jgi:beta-galactosidase
VTSGEQKDHVERKMLVWHHSGKMAAFAIAALVTATLHSQRSSSGEMGPIVIKADLKQSAANLRSDYVGGDEKSITGDKIGVNAQYLTYNGRPWLPVMGEFHFSRYPEDEWEDEILKMKAGGVQIISTYVIWVHHEELEGQFDWSSQRNLRQFVALCKKHGMYVFLRIGPWVHGEVRNGGLPDWVLRETKSRENDPRYLSLVDKFDSEIAKQVDGLLWKDGGPVIGIQIENEYSNRKPGGGVAHIVELKHLARENGLDVPLYTVTGWDNAIYPEREVLPVYGAYAGAPWDPSNGKLPPSEAYLFRFGSRVSGNMGAMPASSIAAPMGDPSADPPYPTPFLTAEVGSGLEDTYHRRPIVDAADVTAIPEVLIGSGANLLGYYMFHGGENPDGKRSTLNESRATGYPTDVPVKSYDFQAPLGEFGQERPSYYSLKLLNYFVNDFGSLLAPMTVFPPADVPRDSSEFATPRVSLRMSEEGGFLFVNNYVRGASMPERKKFQVEVESQGKTMIVPDNGVDIPSGSYFIWPVGIEIGGFHLNYSTAQLFSKIDEKNYTTYFFFAVPGVSPNFSFSDLASTSVACNSGNVETVRGSTVITHVMPGEGVAFELLPRDSSKHIRIVLLPRDQAGKMTKVAFEDGIHLVSSTDEVFSDGEKLYLRSTAGPHFQFGVYPDIRTIAISGHAIKGMGSQGIFHTYSSDLPICHVAVKVTPPLTRDDQESVNLLSSLDRTKSPQSPPSDAAFNVSPQWQIQVRPLSIDSLSNIFLNISYRGDVARLTADGKLLTDNFYNGRPWVVGIRRFVPQLKDGSLILTIAPLTPGNDIVFDDPASIDKSQRPVASVERITAAPEYRLVVNTK